MKILFLAHSHSIHTIRWVNYFIAKGCEVYVISFEPSEIKGAKNIYLKTGQINRQGNNFKYIFKIFHIIYYVYKIKPDVLNSHFLSSFGLLAYLTFYKNHIINLYGTDLLINARSSIPRKWVFKKVLAASTHIFSVSEKMTEVVINDFRQPNKKVTTIQYGVNTELFKIDNPYNEREIDFLTNRYFVENSNYDFMMNVFSKLKHLLPVFQMVIIGSGPEKEKIIKKLEKSDLSENVAVLNTQSEQQMAKYLNKTKFYLSFTSSDGTPLSLFEAAACGCFPILSNNDSNLEWFGKGLRALIIDLNNVNSTVDQIFKLINKDFLPFQEENRNFVMKHMDYNKNMDYVYAKFQNLYKLAAGK